MPIDPTADRPVYKQLADLIRSEIKNGDFKPGQRLPAQKDYVQEHWVARDTVDRALNILRNEGLIVTDRAGSRVRRPTAQTTVFLQQGKVTARMPTEPERRRLGISEGVPLFVIQRDGHDEEIHPADQVSIQAGNDTATDEQPQLQRNDQPQHENTAPADAQRSPAAEPATQRHEPRPRWPRRDPAIISQAVARYKAGATLRAIEAEMRLSKSTIRNLLHDQGVTMRPPHRPRTSNRPTRKPPPQDTAPAGTKPTHDEDTASLMPQHLSALIGALQGPTDLGRHHDKYVAYPRQ